MLSRVQEYEEDEGEASSASGLKRKFREPRKLEYLVGVTIIPKNMMLHGDSFIPVDALDCATCSFGVLVTRAKKDANDAVHPVSLSVLMAPEGSVAVRAHCRAEKSILGPTKSFLDRAHTIQDGGYALREDRLKVRCHRK